MKNIPLWKPIDPKYEGLSQGEKTEELEMKIAAFLGVKYAVAVSSGTAALYLSLRSCGIGVGHEVLVPDLTAIGTVNAVAMTGAKPVFHDVDYNNCLNLDKTPINVDAVIAVHLNGRAVSGDWTRYQNYGIPIIEDACQAFGSRVGSKYLGTIGDCGCFSFSPTKTIYTGQGGMVVTNHYWLYEKVRMLRDQGRRCKGENYLEAGGNFKFTDLQARIAVEQLDKLDLDFKIGVYATYRAHLTDVLFECFMLASHKGEVIWLPDVFTEKRDQLRHYLKTKGITTRKFYPPLHTHAPYFTRQDFPNSERSSEQGLWLPSQVKVEQISYICNEIKKFIEAQK